MDLEKTIQDAVDNSIKAILPGVLSNQISSISAQLEQAYSVRTYNIQEACKETGIGYKKLLAAVKRGELPSMTDGKHYRIIHTDLKKWINEELKSKIVRK